MAQSLEMTEPSNAPCSEVTGPFDVPHSSEVAGPSSSSERIVSLHALNNKEKHIKLLTLIATCCMCFGSFQDDVCDGDGAGWVSCHYGRWLHEDCIEEYVVSSSGVEHFCHFVLMDILHKM